MKLTKQKKLDKRFATTEQLKRWFNKYTAAAGMWGFLIGSLLSMYFSLNAKTPLLDPRGTGLVPQVVEVKAQEKDYHSDALTYIRHRGQELGFDDYTISKFIRVGRCESGFKLDQNAKNKSSTATGIYQIIIGTWDGNRCQGERWDFVDNIDCAYKLLKTRGFQPWNSSKSCWNK